MREAVYYSVNESSIVIVYVDDPPQHSHVHLPAPEDSQPQ